ncbi:MAG: dTDP-4-dehydrorhamnose 3,5-epimerase family protein [Rhodobacteraceae bacterium]|nr:dTDP-4-dehydrorhamnose 3,5-epimerase family protein [Paracoccaceae bacterium]
MEIIPLRIDGAFLVNTQVIEDPRGFFLETVRHEVLAEALGRPVELRQSNHSRSQARTLRGFRCEPWDKLIYVPHGRIIAAVADPRQSSPTFGEHELIPMGDAPAARTRLFVSRGLANGFYCETEADYVNDVSEIYTPSVRRGFRWNDPTLAIPWPDPDPILSEADQNLPTLEEMLAAEES